MTDVTLPPLPEYGAVFEPEGAYNSTQMRYYATIAVMMERERWRLLLSPDHVYLGQCPDVEHQDRRDAECPVCVKMGELT